MNSVQLEGDPLPSIVLLVDRDQAALASYSTRLAIAGLWPATCADPLEAIGAALELKPDLLVTSTFDDLGFDLVKSFKTDPRTESLPVILLADRNPQSSSLADVCLQKPVSAEQLLASSRSLIARSTGLRTHSLLAPAVPDTTRACPGCGHALAWVERGRLLGVEYDYYRWCENGCGLYCYERQAECWLKLA